MLLLIKSQVPQNVLWVLNFVWDRFVKWTKSVLFIFFIIDLLIGHIFLRMHWSKIAQLKVAKYFMLKAGFH